MTDSSIVSVDNLVFSYPGTTAPTLKGLSFDIAQGEVFGFLGPSGSGKSTTQRILIGLLKSFEGRVAVFGDRPGARQGDYYERLGVSFEVPNLYLKLTALENLRYFQALYHHATAEPRELLDWVGLEDDANTRVSQFSKGMKVRLTFARALLNLPNLLFLDEPTAGLDPVNGQRIKDLIRAEQERGTTVFLTTHDMSVADQLCDRVSFIVDGALVCTDTPRTLKLRHGQRTVRVETRDGDGLIAQDFPLDDLGRNAGFLSLLQRGPVETIHTQETTLEQVFIDVTGRGLA